VGNAAIIVCLLIFMAIVYIHRKLDDDNIFYIGISKNKRRAFETFAKVGNRRNIVWKRVSDKHGVKVEITHEDICWEEACSLEIYLINFWKEQGLHLANLTNGGEGVQGIVLTQDQIKKRVSYLHSEESKKRQKEAMSRLDVKAKQSKIQKKIYSNSELRKKQSEIQKIIQNTPQAKEKNRQRALKQFSNIEQRKKISNSLKEYYANNINPNNKKTYQYDIDGNLINCYISTKIAAQINSFNEKCIIRSIKYDKIYKNFLWKRE